MVQRHTRLVGITLLLTGSLHYGLVLVAVAVHRLTASSLNLPRYGYRDSFVSPSLRSFDGQIIAE